MKRAIASPGTPFPVRNRSALSKGGADGAGPASPRNRTSMASSSCSASISRALIASRFAAIAGSPASGFAKRRAWRSGMMTFCAKVLRRLLLQRAYRHQAAGVWYRKDGKTGAAQRRSHGYPAMRGRRLRHHRGDKAPVCRSRTGCAGRAAVAFSCDHGSASGRLKAVADPKCICHGLRAGKRKNHVEAPYHSYTKGNPRKVKRKSTQAHGMRHIAPFDFHRKRLLFIKGFKSLNNIINKEYFIGMHFICPPPNISVCSPSNGTFAFSK